MLAPRTRRRLLAGIGVFAGGLVGALAAVPFVGVLLAPLRRKAQQSWRVVGRVQDFTVGETVQVEILDAEPLAWAGYTERSAAWLRRESEARFVVFSAHCTHVGCPVRWMDSARLFLCPCHGGAFYGDGSVAGGPPPHPLPRHAVRVRDGQVEVLTRPAYRATR